MKVTHIGLYQLMAVCHLSVGVSAGPAHRQSRRSSHAHTPAQVRSAPVVQNGGISVGDRHVVDFTSTTRYVADVAHVVHCLSD